MSTSWVARLRGQDSPLRPILFVMPTDGYIQFRPDAIFGGTIATAAAPLFKRCCRGRVSQGTMPDGAYLGQRSRRNDSFGSLNKHLVNMKPAMNARPKTHACVGQRLPMCRYVIRIISPHVGVENETSASVSILPPCVRYGGLLSLPRRRMSLPVCQPKGDQHGPAPCCNYWPAKNRV